VKTISIEDLHSPSSKLQLFLFNVGQGDHMLLKFPTQEYGIIDFFYDTSYNIVEPPCLTYFKELKRNLPVSEFEKITISFFCISHTDKDHVKGICETIKWFHDNGIFIRDFWLAAARDESQLYSFLKDKLALMIENLNVQDRLKYSANINLYNEGIAEFFSYFEKWKKKEFKSTRYSEEDIGTGEYLVEIRSLRRPCSLQKCQAINMGPLGTQIDKYINNLTLDIIKKILGINNIDDTTDKNLVSHILRIKFGSTNILFGGDTDKEIWEECLEKYEHCDFTFVHDFGNFDSQFIKVSHHGSKNSSSSKIWEKIIGVKGIVYLGISAGNHMGFKHPNVETLNEIRNLRKDVNILSTNICQSRIMDNHFDKEYHLWYDECIERNLRYGKDEFNSNDQEINDVINKTKYHDDISETKDESLGLFAYIFEISDNLDEVIKVRMALSKTNRFQTCFHGGYCDQAQSTCKKEYKHIN
jgi:beta-lactamase superfamily II metal-dependent hydrolase